MERKRIKVAIIVNELLRGGAQHIIFDLARNVDRSSFELLIIHLKEHKQGDTNFKKECENAGVRVISCYGKQKFSFREVKTLYQNLKIEKPDVVHTFLPYAGIFGRLMGRLAGVPLIFTTQCNLPATYSPRSYWMDRFTLPLARAWVGANESIERAYGDGSQAYLDKESWQNGRRHFTITAGVDITELDTRIKAVDRERMRRELGVPLESTLILMTARFVSWKGHKDLVAGFALMKEQAYLILVGWGELQEEIEEQALNEGVRERIIFLGARSDVPELLAVTDVYVQTHCKDGKRTIWRGPNTSQMEACAAHVPSVSTDVPDIEFLIQDGITGKIAEQNNPASIAKTLDYIITNKDKAHAMAHAARARVESRYSVTAMTHSYQLLWSMDSETDKV